MEKANNPFQLEVGQKILIKHLPTNSPWFEVEVVCFNELGQPCLAARNFADVLTDEYETDVVIPFKDSKLGQALMSPCEKEAEAAWLERAKRDKQQYACEEQAFHYYWQMTH